MDSLNLPLASAAQYIFGFLMFITALFLILLVLVQRGRGGGLAGAFGGMGGQSAFGTKAGDLFTRLTMGVAAFWIVLCISAIWVLNRQGSPLGGSGGASAFEEIESGLQAPATTTTFTDSEDAGTEEATAVPTGSNDSSSALSPDDASGAAESDSPDTGPSEEASTSDTADEP